MLERKKSNSIRKFLFVGMGVFVVFLLSITALMNYNLTNTIVERTIEDNFIGSAETFTKNFDVELLKKLSEAEEISESLNAQINANYNSTREEYDKLMYYYTFKLDENNTPRTLIDYSVKDVDYLEFNDEVEAIDLEHLEPIIKGEKKFVSSGIIEDETIEHPYMSIYYGIYDGQENLIAFAGFDFDTTSASSLAIELMKTNVTNYYVVIILALLSFTIIGYRIVKIVLMRLENLSLALNQFSDGQITKSAETIRAESEKHKKAKDEVTDLINEYKDFSEKMTHFFNQTNEVTTSFSIEFERTAEDLDNSIRKLSESSERLGQTIDNSESSKESLNQCLISLEEVTTAISKLSESAYSILENTEKNYSQTSEVYEQAMVLGQELNLLGEKVTLNVEKVRTLTEEYNIIEEMLSGIRGIADQTNLLALNASIEAARAGEHGKGFAVVASEVKKLAEQSKNMSDQISEKMNSLKQLNNEVIQNSEESEKASQRTKESLQVVLENSSKTKENIQEIKEEISDVSSVAEEIAASSQELLSAVTETVTQIEENQKSVVESVSSTKEEINSIRAASDDISSLKEASDYLKEQVGKYT